MPLEHIVGFGRRDVFRHNFLSRSAEEGSNIRKSPFDRFVQHVVELMEISPEVWRSDLGPWEKLVDRGFQEAPKGRLLSLIAIVSTAVSSGWKQLEDGRENEEGIDFQASLRKDSVQGVWDERGFTPTLGLVRRLYFAKCRGGDLSWWQSVLHSSEGDEQTTLLASLVCWGKNSVLKSLSREIGDALDGLDSDGWSWFWNLASLAISVGGPQIERLDEDWFLKNEVLNERLAVILVRRLSETSNRRKVARKCFHGYKGGDARILQTAAEWELLSEPSADIDWEFAKRLSTQARKSGVDYLFSHSHARYRVEVPGEVARYVLEECNSHNWQFVSLCERSFGSLVAQKARRVSAISEGEDWFISESDNGSEMVE